MHKVEFRFQCGDFVRTRLGRIGIVVSCVEEYGSHVYFVDSCHSGRRVYNDNQLAATDDRPLDELAKRPAEKDADPTDALSN